MLNESQQNMVIFETIILCIYIFAFKKKSIKSQNIKEENKSGAYYDYINEMLKA